MSEEELKHGYIAPRDIVEEMEESYLNYSAECDVEYNDDTVRDSITETYHIAMNLIEDFLPSSLLIHLESENALLTEQAHSSQDIVLHNAILFLLQKTGKLLIAQFSKALPV